MHTINIENLSFDAKVDREAMNAIAGGWSLNSIISKVVKGVKRAPRRGARYVGNYFRSIARNSLSVRGWF